jgi:hypothetical protein
MRALMQVQLRRFKHVDFLLLLPESREEEAALDRLGNLATRDTVKLAAELTSDDSFRPYVRIKV